MPIDTAKIQWDTPTIDPSTVQWDAPQSSPIPTGVAPTRQAPGFMTRLGRGAASLADVTLGGVLPAIAQQVAYPLARMGRTPEEAQAATQRVVGAVDQPFGKAFGVADTPEYQQESGRQLLDFIGQNFQKGSKWISDKTGLPQSDVESYLGTAAIASPVVAPKVSRAVQSAIAPSMEKAVVGTKMSLEPRTQARLEKLSAEDYARGPQIDAVAEAQRLKLAMKPTDIQSTTGPRLMESMAGEKGVDAITAFNKNRIREIAVNELGLPPTAQLNGETAFKQARVQLEKPYREVGNLPIQQADDAMIQRLENIRSDLDVIGAKEYAPAISKIVDDAIAKTQTGLTGKELLKNVSVLRERARKTYNNKAATTEALDVADTNLRIATELESLIDNSISNPKLLEQYRDARQKMARTYAYEGATDFNTGMVDASKLARITSKNNALTGDIASLGKIAGNFPERFTTVASTPWSKAAALGRTGLAGSLGGLAGYALGGDYASAAIGSVLGAGAGRVGQSAAARQVASPGYQAGLQLRDMRIPVNQLAASMRPVEPSVTTNSLVPYDYSQSVVMPGEQPNFVFGRPEAQVTAGMPQGGPAQLAAPSAQGTMNALRTEQARAGEMSRTLGQQAEAAQAAQAAAAPRQPATGGIQFDLDPVTGRLVPTSAGVRGATPEVFQADTGASLKSATDKVAAGQQFAMSAAEKVAWDKTRVDLASVAPEYKSLTSKQLSVKMMDRQWVADTISKIQEKIAAFDEIGKRAQGADAIRAAVVARDKLADTLMTLEETLRPPRPVSGTTQGPKTRDFIRNQLNPSAVNPSTNALAP